MKHAHLRSLVVQRRLLKRFGITPARYELLLVILEAGRSIQLTKKRETRRMLQSEIWKMLGVSSVTVCKMLQALEELKLVTRRRWLTNDRRQRDVSLTWKALRLLGSVRRHLIEPGFAYSAAYEALGSPAYVGTAEFLLARFRKRLGDTGDFYYPHCDRTLYQENNHRRRPPVSLQTVLMTAGILSAA